RETPDTGSRADPARPSRDPDVRRRALGEELAQPLEAGQRPGRDEVIDEWICGLHPRRERLVSWRAGKWVEPDQPMAVALESGGLGRDEGGVAAVPPVRDDHDDAARPQDTAGPMEVEVPEAGADPRAAGPVGDGLGPPSERRVAVALAKESCHARQPSPEHERLGPHPVRRSE